MKYIMIAILGLIAFAMIPKQVEAKSYVRSYLRGGSRVRSYTRYKADGYRFNNYQYRPDRGYHR